MRGYRAAVAFDGMRRLPGGALVLVEQSTIVAVEPVSAAVPDACVVVDHPALLPGLIDSHVHLCGDSGPRALEQFAELSPERVQDIIETAEQQHLRSGVTAVRDLGDLAWAVVDRPRAAAGPTVVAAGPPLTSPGGHCWAMGGEVAGIEGLRRAVRERAERGADVVKIMASGGVLTPGTDLQACQFSLDEMRAVVDEAHRLGLPVTAHAHGLAAVRRSVEAGVDGIEHCSCLTPDGPRLPTELAVRLATAGTYVCPTLGTLPGVDPPPHVQARLVEVGADLEQHREHAAALQRAGVTLTAGTDAGIGPSKRHGLVPMAVAELVGLGMPPSEALTAATSIAARACGLEARTGRLAVGLDADLLLLDADPLTDITTLQRPRAVVSRGREVTLTGQPAARSS
jgi:imidazolonepropionase-like amidohydrolase